VDVSKSAGDPADTAKKFADLLRRADANV